MDKLALQIGLSKADLEEYASHQPEKLIQPFPITTTRLQQHPSSDSDQSSMAEEVEIQQPVTALAPIVEEEAEEAGNGHFTIICIKNH